MLAGTLLARLMKQGTLRVIDAHGKLHEFRGAPGGRATIRLHDPKLHWKLFFNPRLCAGESYMNGTLTLEEGTSIFEFLDLVGLNLHLVEPTPIVRLCLWAGRMWRPVMQHNPLGLARKHVAHHYDLSDELFDLFLDSDRQYSCAYFVSPNDTLEQAQAAKKRHLASKLALDRPGLKVLDIGSGWGGLGLYLARSAGAEVTGVTLSTSQQSVSKARAEQLGLADRARFLLKDYREIEDKFDRIVSVGMFEHVGVTHYREFFAKLRDLLTEDGVALVHTIARFDGPSVTNPWLRKYVFPGAYCPALSEVFAAIEKTGLKVADMEILRLHYAETLKHWARNFRANRDKIKAIYDERFCRLWEFYLAGSEVAFRRQDHMVSQIQLVRDQSALPLTRDYMLDWERAHWSEGATAASA
jgi:cyclopropane-fatty-acyl-phospholipid synthase